MCFTFRSTSCFAPLRPSATPHCNPSIVGYACCTLFALCSAAFCRYSPLRSGSCVLHLSLKVEGCVTRRPEDPTRPDQTPTRPPPTPTRPPPDPSQNLCAKLHKEAPSRSTQKDAPAVFRAACSIHRFDDSGRSIDRWILVGGNPKLHQIVFTFWIFVPTRIHRFTTLP